MNSPPRSSFSRESCHHFVGAVASSVDLALNAIVVFVVHALSLSEKITVPRSI